MLVREFEHVLADVFAELESQGFCSVRRSQFQDEARLRRAIKRRFPRAKVRITQRDVIVNLRRAKGE